jgi:hypothetical protein
MKETITLYNHFHYGDIFLSRMLIKGLSEKFNIKFYHKLNVGLFDDLDFVEEIGNIPNNFSLHQTNLEQKIVNTWIGQNHMSYIKNTSVKGCNFDNYFRMIQDVLNYYNIPIREKEYYLPTIYYDKLKDFETIKNNFLDLKNKFEKCILISNGKVLSAQSLNFDFTPILNKLSEKYPKYLFLVTEDISFKKDNIKSTYELTNRIPDLLYISYFSTQSEVCIGRSSGPYTFSMNYDNFMNNQKKFISFNNTESEGFFYNNHKFNFVWSNNYDLGHIYNTINNNL